MSTSLNRKQSLEGLGADPRYQESILVSLEVIGIIYELTRRITESIYEQSYGEDRE